MSPTALIHTGHRGFGKVRVAALVVFGLLVGCSSDQRSPGAGQASAAWFVEITRTAGLDFSHEREPEGTYFMPEIMGSGAGFLDFDGDGRLDLLLVNGSWSEGAAASHARLQLDRQGTDGTFKNVSRAAGLSDTPGYGVGLAVGDVNDDGHSDVYMTAFGGDRLWMNNGDGTFCDCTGALENVNRRWGTAAAFFDYDRDGWLDLYVVNYLDYFPGTPCDEGTGRLDYCGPRSFEGTTGKLYRNLGGLERGRMFADQTVDAGLAVQGGPGLGLICRDFNDDLRPDIYVANDMSPDLLWIQDAAGTFHEEGVQRGIAYNRMGQAEASMGIVADDLNADGISDLFITNLGGETSTLFLGLPEARFVDGTGGSGLGSASLPYTGFGVAALDLEFDGDLDLIAVNGRVRRGPPLVGADLGRYWNAYAQPNLILLNDGAGRFTDASRSGGALTQRLDVSRALVAGDLDDDGDLDLVVTSCAGPARLYRNDVPRGGAWVRFRLIDRGSQRNAWGARIIITAGGRTQSRDVNPSSGYLSSHDPRLLFGLGDCALVDSIAVVWPDGQREEYGSSAVDREIVLRRGQQRIELTVEEP
jgi:hypothetical protein